MKNISYKTVFLFIFLLLATVTVLINTPVIEPYHLTFATEYGFVAEALVTGKGFSNPFGVDSGPTAWTTPLYPLLMALVFKFAGIKSVLSAWILIVIKQAALAAAGTLLFDTSTRIYNKKTAIFVIPIFLFFIFLSPWVFFKSLIDSWLLVLVGALMLNCFCRLKLSKSQPGLKFGILGGLAAMTHPVLGFAYALMTVLPGNGFKWKNKLLMGVISLAFISPWIVRNYVVFDQVIPLKSNVAYEAFQGNFISTNGILTTPVFVNYHPSHDNAARQLYLDVGEKKFLAHYKEEFLHFISEDIVGFAKKSVFRLGAIYLYNVEAASAKETSFREAIVKSALYLIPLLSICVWFIARYSHNAITVMPFFLQFTFLFSLPFVFIGFYFRYRIPLLPAFVMILFIAMVEVYRKYWLTKTLKIKAV